MGWWMTEDRRRGDDWREGEEEEVGVDMEGMKVDKRGKDMSEELSMVEEGKKDGGGEEEKEEELDEWG